MLKKYLPLLLSWIESKSLSPVITNSLNKIGHFHLFQLRQRGKERHSQVKCVQHFFLDKIVTSYV
jgi:hypothetical protein